MFGKPRGASLPSDYKTAAQVAVVPDIQVFKAEQLKANPRDGGKEGSLWTDSRQRSSGRPPHQSGDGPGRNGMALQSILEGQEAGRG